MNYLLGAIITLGAFILGYYMGRGTLDKAPDEIQQMVDKIIKKDEPKVGVLRRPTQQDLDDKANPKIAEGKKEFKNLLDTLPIKE